MPKKRKADSEQAALSEELAAPARIEIDGAGWHVRMIALGYPDDELPGERPKRLADALHARYPRARVRIETTRATGDELLSALLAPLRLVGIASDDEEAGRRARAYDVARLREEATREVLAFVKRWLERGEGGV